MRIFRDARVDRLQYQIFFIKVDHRSIGSRQDNVSTDVNRFRNIDRTVWRTYLQTPTLHGTWRARVAHHDNQRDSQVFGIIGNWV